MAREPVPHSIFAKIIEPPTRESIRIQWMSTESNNLYTWGVRLTWVVTGVTFAAVFFLIPKIPEDNARASLLLTGIFGIFALSGGVGHLALFGGNHPLKRIENNTRVKNLWQFGFGLLWISTLGFTLYFAVAFILAIWASI